MLKEQYFTTNDDTLNKHIFNFIPMKLVDFKRPKVYQQIDPAVRRPETKK